MAAPLQLLGIDDRAIPADQSAAAQAFATTIGHAVEVLAPFARPSTTTKTEG